MANRADSDFLHGLAGRKVPSGSWYTLTDTNLGQHSTDGIKGKEREEGVTDVPWSIREQRHCSQGRATLGRLQGLCERHSSMSPVCTIRTKHNKPRATAPCLQSAQSLPNITNHAPQLHVSSLHNLYQTQQTTRHSSMSPVCTISTKHNKPRATAPCLQSAQSLPNITNHAPQLHVSSLHNLYQT